MTGSGTFIPQSIADIDKILSTTVLAVEEKKAVARKLKQARESLASERSRLAQLQAAMEREQKDVARLEGLSLAGLFYTVAETRAGQKGGRVPCSCATIEAVSVKPGRHGSGNIRLARWAI